MTPFAKQRLGTPVEARIRVTFLVGEPSPKKGTRALLGDLGELTKGASFVLVYSLLGMSSQGEQGLHSSLPAWPLPELETAKGWLPTYPLQEPGLQSPNHKSRTNKPGIPPSQKRERERKQKQTNKNMRRAAHVELQILQPAQQGGASLLDWTPLRLDWRRGRGCHGHKIGSDT